MFERHLKAHYQNYGLLKDHYRNSELLISLQKLILQSFVILMRSIKILC